MTDYEDRRQRSISIGQAANITAELVKASADPDDSVETLVGRWAANLEAVTEGLVATQTKYGLQEAFPGATVEPAPAVAPAPAAAPQPQYTQPQSAPNYQPPAYTPAPAAPQQPPAAPGVTDGDPQVAADWQLFFSDPTAWWDNRRNKKNPKGPDFSHRSVKRGDYAIGLWTTGKKNPSWLPAALQDAIARGAIQP